ncbi:ESCRT-II complex, vps25 subunit [Jaminaea rosea]|uniref:ESCRT-II complex subunit VPS25 n=1 Tax=Jaminaea rosea TaxID=1569628 RepID=A0A316ULQ9_9BASI|nr:ESCRT-II complex, vps25 subunit [Jaminaea rosea]PWN26179.1 ESCRT-II complex, vps25 subunit [Jaminaea rosea]
MSTASPQPPFSVLGGSSASGGTAAAGFPPTLFSFPPFFTLQPNPATLKTQLTAWSSLVQSYCKSTRTFYLDADDAASHGRLWSNPAIGRSLDAQGRARVLLFLVEQGRAVWEGQGQGQEKGKTQQQAAKRALILWRRPDEWGRLIRDWIVATGQDKSIMTFFELTEGDLVEDQEFANLPPQLLRLALETLVAKGQAQIFSGSERGEGMEGVKFS